MFPGVIVGQHLSADAVGGIVERASSRLLLTHDLRRRFATEGHRRTRNLVAIQQLMGHASLRTTQTYIATDYDELLEVVRAVA